MNLQEAKEIALKVYNQLEPHCERIAIAGSIRRMKPEVKDIEIVCIPKPYEIGLFESGIATVIDQWAKIKGDLPCKYTQRMLPEGIKLDIFMTNKVNWGWQLALRTGSRDYNRFVLLRRLKNRGFDSKDGHIWQGDNLVKTKEEEDVFDLIGLRYVPPVDRNYSHPMKETSL